MAGWLGAGWLGAGWSDAAGLAGGTGLASWVMGGGVGMAGGGGGAEEEVALPSVRSTTTEPPVWKLFTCTGTASGKVAILRSGLRVTPLR